VYDCRVRIGGDRAYVRSWINKRAAVQQTTTNGNVGREAFTTTDLRLRDGPTLTASRSVWQKEDPGCES